MTSPSATDPLAQAWRAALAAEQVAAFGYGTLGPWLTAGSHVQLARSCEQAHRALAAAAATRGALGPVATSAPPDYQLPVKAVDDPSAQQLAIELEVRTAAAWRYVLAQLSSKEPASDTWSAALGALTDSAVRAVRWRRISTPEQASTAFPGV